ncbi:Putative clathrin assembly protein At2g25430 [Linum grandiflorum]
MAPSTIRKAIGAVKDQTSISLAKVAGTVAPEMEVLVVKATSHDQDPTDEKYYREILYLTSTSSRGYIGACIATVSKRLTKTHDWIVALKSLMLVHRLLADGHPSFQDEILHAMRTGMRVLNMSDFRAEASSNSWDHAGFVRFYSMYLEEKVRCSAFEKNLSGNNTNRGDYNERNDNRKVFGERDDGFDQKWRRFDEREGEFGRRETGRDDHDEYGKRSWSHGDDSDSMNSNQKDVAPPIKEMGTEAVIGKSKQLLKILDRVLACRPAGMARSNRLVLVAFQQVVKESFVLYVEICETLGVLLDRFTEMGYVNSVKTFEIHVSAGKMIDELIGFYGWCKDIGIARSSEYPDVQKVTDKLLGNLEGFLREMAARPPMSPERSKEEVKIIPVEEKEEEPYMNDIKALPPPENYTPQAKPLQQPEPQKVVTLTQDLVNLRDDGVTADGEGNKLALSLFSGAQTANGDGSWETFASNGEVTSAWQNPAAEIGKTDWELALVESGSILSKQKATMGGGLDSLILNGMYDQGAVNQHSNAAQMSNGSGSSVALRNGNDGMLALPAPDGTIMAVGNQDPFAASVAVPPPSYVQIAEMQMKQQLFIQEQQTWQQYGGGAGMYNAMPAPQGYGMQQPGGFYQTGPY